MENANDESRRASSQAPDPDASRAAVHVRLLGGLAAEAGGRACPPPAHPQGPALLAWLALHPGEHPRGSLAALLWPSLAESNARHALREAVWALRRSLAPFDDALLDGRATVGLRCWTDVVAFERFVAAGDLGRALALCAGDGGVLLADAGLDEHPWVRTARAEHAPRVAAVRAEHPGASRGVS